MKIHHVRVHSHVVWRVISSASITELFEEKRLYAEGRNFLYLNSAGAEHISLFPDSLFCK